MLGFKIVLGTLFLLGLTVLAARAIDRMRGLDPDDRWPNWYRGKSADAGAPSLYDGPEYDSMNDHGNRDADGGL